LRLVRHNAPDVLTNALIVPADDARGFVVIRVFVPDQSWAPVVERFIDSMTCQNLNF